MTEKTVSQLRTELKALDSLQRSRGWAVVRETMDAEIRQAARHLASKPNATNEELRWRAGTIYAAEKLLDLPDQLIARLETALMLAVVDDEQTARRDNET